MATEYPKYCIKCGGMTIHSVEFDPDSLPDEPLFIEVCLRCNGKSTELTKTLPFGQRRLEL